MTNSLNTDNNLFHDLAKIIDQGKNQVAVQVNSTLTITYWQVGKRINDDILQNRRAEYGKQIVASLATQLIEKYGRSFDAKNLRRMMQLADVFPDFEIVVPLVRQLSWSHFIILIPLKESTKRLFYAQKSIESSWGKLRKSSTLHTLANRTSQRFK